MNLMSSEYSAALGVFSDLNNRAVTLGIQATALAFPAYLPMLSSAVSGYSEYLRTSLSSSSAQYLPSIDSSSSAYLHTARTATTAITGLMTSDSLIALTSIGAKQSSSWLGTVDPLYIGCAGVFPTRNPSDYGIAAISPLVHSNSAFSVHNNYMVPGDLSGICASSHLTKMGATSLLSESLLGGLNPEIIGSQIRIASPERKLLADSLTSISSSYASLFGSVDASITGLTDRTLYGISSAPMQYYTATDFCRTISTDVARSRDTELFSNNVLAETRQATIQNLPRIGSDLLPLWEGANRSLESDNPDRIRHFSTSIRELVCPINPQTPVWGWMGCQDDVDNNVF